ncbi:MAG: phosphate ABC transporter permease PstA [Bacteroidia bacterium]
MIYETRKRIQEQVAIWVLRMLSFSILGILFIVLGYIISKGISVISWDFITKAPEDGMTKGGIFPAIVGTLCLIGGSMVIAFPIGVMSGIYMNEYVRDGWFKKTINVMTNNLAGIPSIVFGLFGMEFFVNELKWGDSIIAGSFTLGLLVLPVIIRTTEESLKAVSSTFREASYGLGASKWQTTRNVVLPIAMPNILTGLILSMSRVSGETAPILFTVAAYFLPKLPHSIYDQVMALPYHLYVIATSGNNITESRPIAYGTALVLIMIVLILNLLANWLRRYLTKKVKMN